MSTRTSIKRKAKEPAVYKKRIIEKPLDPVRQRGQQIPPFRRMKAAATGRRMLVGVTVRVPAKDYDTDSNDSSKGHPATETERDLELGDVVAASAGQKPPADAETSTGNPSSPIQPQINSRQKAAIESENEVLDILEASTVDTPDLSGLTRLKKPLISLKNRINARGNHRMVTTADEDVAMNSDSGGGRAPSSGDTSMSDKTEPESGEDFTRAIGQVWGSTTASSRPEEDSEHGSLAPDPFRAGSDESRATVRLRKSPSSHSKRGPANGDIPDSVGLSEEEEMEWDDEEFLGVSDVRSVTGEEGRCMTEEAHDARIWDHGVNHDLGLETSDEEDINEGDDEMEEGDNDEAGGDDSEMEEDDDETEEEDGLEEDDDEMEEDDELEAEDEIEGEDMEASDVMSQDELDAGDTGVQGFESESKSEDASQDADEDAEAEASEEEIPNIRVRGDHEMATSDHECDQGCSRSFKGLEKRYRALQSFAFRLLADVVELRQALGMMDDAKPWSRDADAAKARPSLPRRAKEQPKTKEQAEPRDPDLNSLYKQLRKFLDRLLSWTDVETTFPPSPDPSWEKPTRKTFTFQWDAPLASRWNKQLAPLFEYMFLKRHQEWSKFAKTEPTKIRTWFHNRARALIKKRNATLQAQSPSTKRAQKAKSARQTRKSNDYHNRLAAFDDVQELKPFRRLIRALGINGMSSDEADGDNYLVIRKMYLSVEVTQLLRIADRTYKFLIRRTSGSPGRHRIPSNLVNTECQAVNGLPVNCYDPIWYDSLDAQARRALRAKPAINLTVAESLLRRLEKFRERA